MYKHFQQSSILEATSNGTPQNLVDNGDCPVGYQHHSETDQCYKLNKEKLMWQDAESFCVKEGGHLTSIENEAENKFIVGMLIENI